MSASQRIPRGAIRVELPNVVQRQDYTCGAAAVLAIATYYGAEVTEAELVDVMAFDRRGSDPAHLHAAAAHCGLRVQEVQPMSDAQLRACLDRARPVILMLQAWGDRASYVDHWTDGHWVVAIGYDRRGVYFEDPMLECVRGYLPYAELGARWHDLAGPDDARVERYGLAMWRPRSRGGAQLGRARRLG